MSVYRVHYERTVRPRRLGQLHAGEQVAQDVAEQRDVRRKELGKVHVRGAGSYTSRRARVSPTAASCGCYSGVLHQGVPSDRVILQGGVTGLE